MEKLRVTSNWWRARQDSLAKGLTWEKIMSVTEEIVKEAVGLDFTQQRELLMFVKFLKTKKQGDDDEDFKKFSLESAMRGMEDEPDFYDETPVPRK